MKNDNYPKTLPPELAKDIADLIKGIDHTVVDVSKQLQPTLDEAEGIVTSYHNRALEPIMVTMAQCRTSIAEAGAQTKIPMSERIAAHQSTLLSQRELEIDRVKKEGAPREQTIMIWQKNLKSLKVKMNGLLEQIGGDQAARSVWSYFGTLVLFLVILTGVESVPNFLTVQKAFDLRFPVAAIFTVMYSMLIAASCHLAGEQWVAQKWKQFSMSFGLGSVLVALLILIRSLSGMEDLSYPGLMSSLNAAAYIAATVISVAVHKHHLLWQLKKGTQNVANQIDEHSHQVAQVPSAITSIQNKYDAIAKTEAHNELVQQKQHLQTWKLKLSTAQAEINTVNKQYATYLNIVKAKVQNAFNRAD